MIQTFTKMMIISALFLLIFPKTDAHAVPAFARKYRISCNTCHVAIPKLKPYGDEFAGNGFLLPDGEEPRRAYIDTGDDRLLLNRDFPLAVRLDAYVQTADRDNAKTDLQVPFGIKIMSGGPVSKHISYYFYFYFSERGEVAGVEDAILHFNDIANTPLDIAVGQFQISDPLFKRELRLTYEDYEIYRARPGASRLNLTYDRGFALSYGFDFGLDLTALLVNGNGISEAGEDRLFDLDSDKTYVLRAIQGFEFFSVGAFALSASESKRDSLLTQNNIMIFGPDLAIGNDKIELNLQYLYREDDNVGFAPGDVENTKTQGGFAELIYMPNGDQSLFLFTLLYNQIDYDGDLMDYQTLSFNVSHMAARNVRLMAEFTYDLQDKAEEVSAKSGHRFTIGAVTAF